MLIALLLLKMHFLSIPLDFASCRQARSSQASENRESEMESSPLSKSVLNGSSSKAVLKPRMEEKSSDKGHEDICQRSREPASSPYFCSKHQRWVKSILQECPDECSDELLHQANASLSPPLFHSLSSTSSSQDLTPSDLVPCPPDQHSPFKDPYPASDAQPSEQTQPEEKHSPELVRDTSQTEPLPDESSPRHIVLPALLSPVVRLVDILSVTRSCPTIKPHQQSANHFTMFSNKKAASTPQLLTYPHCSTSENKDSLSTQPESVDLPNATYKLQTAPASSSCQPRNLRPFSKLSRKYKGTCSNTRHSQTHEFSQNPFDEQTKITLPTFQKTCPPLLDFIVSPTIDSSTSTSQSVHSGSLLSLCKANQIPSPTTSSQAFYQNSPKPLPQGHSPFQLNTLPSSTVVPSAFNSDCLAISLDTSKVSRTWMTSSLLRQAVPLQSTMLQPSVSITRLSSRECHRITKGRCSARCAEPVLQGRNEEEMRKEEEEDADSSFDPNCLYSSHSSSDSEGWTDFDPDYKPCIKKKRLLLEYEAARILDHI